MGKWELGMFIQNMTLDSFGQEMLSLIVTGISLADKPGTTGEISEQNQRRDQEMKKANLSLCPQSTLARVNLQLESGSQAIAIHSPWIKTCQYLKL